MNTPPAPARPVDFAAESVAGEEDPGASIDMVASTAPGPPGTGEDLCRTCGGNGQLNGGPCPDCEGTGRITVGTGGD